MLRESLIACRTSMVRGYPRTARAIEYRIIGLVVLFDDLASSLSVLEFSSYPPSATFRQWGKHSLHFIEFGSQKMHDALPQNRSTINPPQQNTSAPSMHVHVRPSPPSASVIIKRETIPTSNCPQILRQPIRTD
jgi:hypothetical protein